jgi:NAD(P) transhydrogenase subunit alpha
MYAKNLYNLSRLLIKDGQLAPDWDDEILAGALLTHQGEITHAPTRALVGGV